MKAELITGESFEAYRERPGMNASVLKAGMVSMKAMRYAATNGKEDTAALAFGRIAHQAVLEGGLTKGAFAVWDGRRAGKEYDAFVAAAAVDGKTVIKPDERDELTALVAAVHSNPEAHQIIEETKHEVSCVWNEPGFALAKCRFDGISADWYMEWKTTSKHTPREFENQAYSLGYHIAAAHYLAGAQACGLTPNIRIISTESTAPYDTIVWRVDDAWLEHGQDERERIWKAYMDCSGRGIYPGHGADEHILSLPTWAMNNAEVNLED